MTAADQAGMLTDIRAIGNVLPLPVRSAAKGNGVLNWQAAHRVANIAAAQAHGRLGVDLGGVQVNVEAAIHAQGAVLMWQQMPSLFGAYVNEPGSVPGILINSGLPRGARRHTAAHELGHAFMGHVTTADDGSTIDTVLGDEFDAIPPANRRRAWPDQEKCAEAFAAWFLMPRRVVASALTVVGVQGPTAPEDVYQLSLLLGTSYRTTLRHLPNLRLIGSQNAQAWSRVAPGTLKAALDRGTPSPASRRGDVYVLNRRFNGLNLTVGVGDRFVAGDDLGRLEPVDELACIGRSDRGLFVYEAVGVTDGLTLTTAKGWSVRVAVSEAPQGLDPRSVR